VDFASNRHYRIDMKSKDFDAYLRLEGPDGKTVARDDDSGGDRNARIVLRSTTAGTYRIIATTYRFNPKEDAKGGAKLGAFTVEVQQGAKLPELTLKDGKVRIESRLTKDDPKDYGSGGYSSTPSRAYTVRFEAEQTYRIDLTSRRFDAFLRLEGPDGKMVAENDDSDEGLDARIVFRCRTTATYRIIVKTVASPWKFGDFALTVQEQR
jgi:serine protease Do